MPNHDYRPQPRSPQGGCLTTLIVLCLFAVVAALAVYLGYFQVVR